MTDLMNTSPRGRHRALTPQEEQRLLDEEQALVPRDIRAALRRAVEKDGLDFTETEWIFDKSAFMGWVARSTSTRGPASRTVLAIANDCRTNWVPQGVSPDSILSRLERVNPIPRTHIEFLLSEQNRFYRGTWDLEPVEDLGWICTRSASLGRKRHFVVALNSRVEKADGWDGSDVEALKPLLVSLLEAGQPQND